jgi:GT2 family glycosyltransferase
MTKSVGVVIPCLNEEKSIQACIESVFACDYSGDVKVVVCDGMSTDSTREIIKNLTATYPHLTLLDNPVRHTPAGLNLGLQHLDTDIKIILGAHATVRNDFIQQNANALEQNTEAGCAGGIINNIYENETSRIIGLAMSSPFGVGNARFRTGGQDGWVDTVAFGSYRKEVFEQIGYFDESLVRNQDDEFNFRLTSNDFKIFFTDKIQSNYHVRASFSKLYKQYFQYGYWKVYVNKKVKAITSARQLFPAVFVAGVLLGAVLSLLHPILMYTWLVGITVYLLAAVVFAMKKSSAPKEIFLVIFSFMILHWAYGSGYLRGIIAFIVLGKNPSKTSKTITR